MAAQVEVTALTAMASASRRPSASTYYVYPSVIGSAVMEVASAGVQRAYVMGSGNVIAQRNADGQFYWLHQDHLGNGRKMTDTSGNLTYRAEFDPYGKLLYEWSQGGQANRNSKKFTGYERDSATGLDYAQARMYGSEWGRFMSPDPMGIASARKTNPKSLNRYSYTEGNPVNYVDRTGKYIESPDSILGSPDWVCRLLGMFCESPLPEPVDSPDPTPAPILENRFPGFNPDDLRQILEAKASAQKMLGNADCQKGLSDAKIDVGKLTDAVDGLVPKPAGFDTQYYKYNIFNAPPSTDDDVSKQVALYNRVVVMKRES